MGEKGSAAMNDKKSDAHEDVLSAVTGSNYFTQLAEAYRLQGRYEEAIDTCRKGLEKMPDALCGRLILGKCYLEKGMIDQAKQELEKVADGIEECLSVYKLLSQIYLQEKNVDQALEVLRKALYFPPQEEKPKKGLTPLEMDLLQQKTKLRSIPAEPDTQEDLAAHGGTLPDDQAKQVMQTDTLAEIYLKQGHPEKALSIYQEILTREPGNTDVQEKYISLQKRLEAQRKAASYQRTMPKLERWLAAVAPKDEPLSS